MRAMSGVTSFILPPSTRGSKKVPTPTSVNTPGCLAAEARSNS